MSLYPEPVLDRAMKIKEVLTRAMSREITWWQAAEIIGISERSMRRWRARLEEDGYSGLYDRRCQRPSPKRVALATLQRVLQLYREKYFDLNVKHFVEKLHEEHGIPLSYTWVKTALQTAGLVQRYPKRGAHRKKRQRRPLPGMMLHIDASRHRWIPAGDRYLDLIVVFDDATSEMYYAQLVEEESTSTVMMALKRVIEGRGLFCSLYSDRASHFTFTPKAGEKVDLHHKTQLQRALHQLGIELILAYSPQARGRCERVFGTWQGRLPQEMRLRGIGTVDEANHFLETAWIAIHNRKFTVEAAQPGTAFLPYSGIDLDKIFSHQEARVVDNDNTVRYRNRCLQIPQQTFRYSLARCPVLVCEHLDRSLSLYYGPHRLGDYSPEGKLRVPACTSPTKKPRAAGRPQPRSLPIKPPGAKFLVETDKERKKQQKRKKAVAGGN